MIGSVLLEAVVQILNFICACYGICNSLFSLFGFGLGDL
jgi:hypothetical protein